MKDILKIQKEYCEYYDKEFCPVNLDQLVVVSNRVLEGENLVERVRYMSPEHMSGWWITDNNFDGNVDLLKNIHFHIFC